MPTQSPSILPSIRTLPLPDETKELFSRAVCLVKQRAGDFETVGAWLDKHYSEATLRDVCQRKYRAEFAYRLRLVHSNGTGNFALSTHKRRLALQEGRSREQLMRETIAEARARGYRLNGSQLVGRCHPDQYPDEKLVDESNYEVAWQSEDKQYRQRFRQIKAERRAAKMDEHDHPEKPGWRLDRAVGEIIEAGYPADTPCEHVEQSRKIVGLAALLVWPEPLPILGELGRWEWESKPDVTWEADPTNPNDNFWRKVSQPPAQDGPHKVPLHLMHARFDGREEVLFHRMPGEPRELQHHWTDLCRFRELLSIAVDELEALPPTLQPVTIPPSQSGTDNENRNPQPTIPKPARLAKHQEDEAKAKADSAGVILKTDRAVYDYFKEHVGESPDDLPDFENWSRNLREYRRLTGTQKNRPRGGRSAAARSVVAAREVEPAKFAKSG